MLRTTCTNTMRSTMMIAIANWQCVTLCQLWEEAAAEGWDGSALHSCGQRSQQQSVSWAAGVCMEHTQTAAVIGFRSGVSERLSSMAMRASSETAAVWIHLFLQPLEFTQQQGRQSGCLCGEPPTPEVYIMPSESPLCLMLTF